MKRMLVILGTLLIAAFALAPAAVAAESPSPAKDLAFRVGIGEDIDGVNPFTSWSSVTWEAFRLNYNFLTWYDEDYKPAPDLATEWEASDDGKVWTFTIREGATWHDGEPFTAGDIAFTYNYILDNELWAYIQYLEHVTEVVAPDDTTLVITSDEPNAGMLALYIPILPEHIWSKIPGDKVETLEDPPVVGTGPFMFDEIKKSRYVTMKANKDYFGGAPTIDTVFFQIYQSGDTLVQDYKAGNLDVAYFESPTFLRSVKNMEGSKAVAVDRIGFHELGFNCWDDAESKGNPLLRDARIRQAFHWAMDKEQIVKQSMDGLATAGTGVISPAAGDWHWSPPEAQLVSYDPEKAKQILEDAGYTDSDGDGIRESAEGKKLSFRFDVMSAYQNDITAGKMIVQWLKDVGVELELNIADEGAFGDRVYDNADMDVYIWSWGGDIDPGFMLSCFTSTQILNWSDCCYGSPVYDEMYREQAAAVDRDDRVEIVHKMQEHLYNEAPYIILWYNLDCEAYQADKWSGWELVPKGDGRPVWTFLRGTYENVKPAAAATTGDSGGLSGGAIAGIIVAAVVVVGAIVFFVLRRSKGGPKAEEL